MTKGKAFLFVHWTLFIMALGSAYNGGMLELWPGLVAGMIANAAAFIGGNVADNGVKGHFYNPNLEGQ